MTTFKHAGLNCTMAPERGHNDIAVKMSSGSTLNIVDFNALQRMNNAGAAGIPVGDIESYRLSIAESAGYGIERNPNCRTVRISKSPSVIGYISVAPVERKPVDPHDPRYAFVPAFDKPLWE